MMPGHQTVNSQTADNDTDERKRIKEKLNLKNIYMQPHLSR